MVERRIELGPHGQVTSVLHFNLTPPYMYIRSAENEGIGTALDHVVKCLIPMLVWEQDFSPCRVQNNSCPLAVFLIVFYNSPQMSPMAL